jgi:cyanate permease
MKTAVRRNAVRIALLALCLLLIAAGIYLREHEKTEARAIGICLGCIGIGD